MLKWWSIETHIETHVLETWRPAMHMQGAQYWLNAIPEAPQTQQQAHAAETTFRGAALTCQVHK